MGLTELLREKRQEILAIAAKHGAYNVRIFGSVARGEAGPESDVDFLVESGRETSPGFQRVIIDLENSWVAKSMWLPKERSIGIKDQVLREAVPL